MLTLISYDIPDDRRRLKLAKTLKDFGDRVQLSVFECRLDPAGLDQLRQRIERLLEPGEDAVRIYRICASCEDRLEILGQGERLEEVDVWIV